MHPAAVVTTVEANRLPAALVLAATVIEQHPGAVVLVVVADAATVPALAVPDGVRVISGEDLIGAELPLLATAWPAETLAELLVGAALESVPAPAVWLRADGEVTAPLELPDAVAGVLVHAGSEADDAVDPGVLVRGAADGDAALDWLADRVGDGVPFAAALAELPARFAEVTVVREPLPVRRHIGVDVGDPRVRPGLDAQDEEAARAFTAYADRLRAVAAGVALASPYTHVDDGTPLDDRLRRLFRSALQDGAVSRAPSAPDAWAAFRAWLTSPAEDPAAGGVSRYLHALYEDRLDLRLLYPDLRDRADRDGFLGWAYVHGTTEGVVPDWARPPAPDFAGPRSDPDAVALGVNVAGYFQSELGIGEAARRVVDALDAAHVPLLMVQGPTLPPSRQGHDAGSTSTEAASFPINLICVNADGLPRFAREAGPGFREGRLNIGMWWWELPDFPDSDRGAFSLVDEVWVGTRYVQDALSPVAPVPVVRVPIPVTAPTPPPRSRADLGLPEGFLVFFAFDHSSVTERKNPIGLIEAFCRAFPEGSGASLVIKSINAADYPRDHQSLLLAAGGRPDVHVIDRYVSAEDRDAMIAGCDVYASLHRAEGFGFTLAEAMALGRPVVATGWSGNVDFMSPQTSWLVPHTMIPVGEGNAPYSASSRWADPDLDAAAAALREIHDHPQEAARRGAAGRAWIAEHHSPEAAGAVMRARLEVLHPLALARADAHDATGFDASRDAIVVARERAARRPEDLVPQGAGGPRGALRRVLLRATRAQADNTRAIQESVLRAVEEGLEVLAAGQHEAQADRRATAQLVATMLERQRAIERRLAELERRG